MPGHVPDDLGPRMSRRNIGSRNGRESIDQADRAGRHRRPRDRRRPYRQAARLRPAEARARLRPGLASTARTIEHQETLERRRLRIIRQADEDQPAPIVSIAAQAPRAIPRGFGSASSSDRYRRGRNATRARSTGRVLRDLRCRSWVCCVRCIAAARQPPRRGPPATSNTSRDSGRRIRQPRSPPPGARMRRQPMTRARPEPSPAPDRTIHEKPARQSAGAGESR